ncbi:MAG: peptidylprolyl isomerase [Candidatus Aenigmarchaeota archaeon]|nr:peptidylprolyl isomerase [Candidatus Aenigmarchaeota archaeon]
MQKGDFIKINYIGRLESGEIFDLNVEEVAKKEGIYNEKVKYRPLSIIVGAGFVIPGLDHALLGMNVGEKKTIEVLPKEAFGERNPSLLRTVSEKEFEGQVNPRPGMIVDFSNTKGRIQSVSSGRVRIDFNHPLAGKTLKYDVEIIEKIAGAEEKVAAILDFFGIEAHQKIAGSVVEIEPKRPVPHQIKERISYLVLEHVANEGKKTEKVRFIDVFERVPEKTL